MKRRHDPDSIASLMISAGGHRPPSIDVMKSELRSDSVIEVPPPPKKEPDPYFIIIKWKFVVPLRRFDKFHDFLAKNEAAIAADVGGLGVGATYAGTYAEVPHGNPHQMFWAYSSAAAIANFKNALIAKPKSELNKNLAAMVKLIDDPNIVMHRLVRGRSLAGMVKSRRGKDPILDLFGG